MSNPFRLNIPIPWTFGAVGMLQFLIACAPPVPSPATIAVTTLATPAASAAKPSEAEPEKKTGGTHPPQNKEKEAIRPPSDMEITQGISLYALHCASCHRQLSRTSMPNRSASRIRSAILQAPIMYQLRQLSDRELAQIAAALATAPPKDVKKSR